jgi:hypothetical protein
MPKIWNQLSITESTASFLYSGERNKFDDTTYRNYN